MPNFKVRSHKTEIMDDPGLSRELLDPVLKELTFINRKLGGYKTSLKGIEELIGEKNNFSFADWGCGGGDTIIKVHLHFKKINIQTALYGYDYSPSVVSFANEVKPREITINYSVADILSSSRSVEGVDVSHNSLFCHHFKDEELVIIIKKMLSQSRLGIVINDLHRHPIAYYSIKILTYFFSKSAMVKNDGPLSVLRAFKRKDWEVILKMAGIKNYDLKWFWAFRWQLIIPKDGNC
ncbi:MAG: 2-polyprenyl-3-methyl-5-hydroxy-6-metoxy-1,4-benzoquinol methylase [Sphingobacteriales bacterium]|jgi:2-polyprenyl-3-methyl-5-hydroxy-6-metoxy-1,4-benzoquinol methylase